MKIYLTQTLRYIPPIKLFNLPGGSFFFQLLGQAKAIIVNC